MAFDPWGNALAYDPGRELADLSDAQLIDLFGIPEDIEHIVPPGALASPTLGAIRRAQGVIEDPDDPFAHMTGEARVALAWELVQEGRRRAIADQLDGIYVGLSVGADPGNVAR